MKVIISSSSEGFTASVEGAETLTCTAPTLSAALAGLGTTIEATNAAFKAAYPSPVVLTFMELASLSEAVTQISGSTVKITETPGNATEEQSPNGQTQAAS